MDEIKRYYYKDNNGNRYSFRVAEEEGDLIEISKEEFEALAQPEQLTAKQIALQEKRKLIAEKKVLLNKYREDVEQVSLFGLTRADYTEKKELCRQLVLELRELEKSV